MRFRIVGQGLAGTALAWQMFWRGEPFTITDRDDATTASKVAAGLITPIIGQRLTLDPHFDRDYSRACGFYRRVEAELGVRFFHVPGAVRILRNSTERERFSRGLWGDRVGPGQLSETHFAPLQGSFAMPSAARLDVLSYLAASRAFFTDQGWFRKDDIAGRGTTTIDCTGIAAMREGRLPADCFQPAKGEILTVCVAGLKESRTIHCGIWLTHWHDDLYRVGATYAWDQLDDRPTRAAREQLAKQLRMFLKLPFEIVGQDAATRPISCDRRPIRKQLHSDHWAFNGFGTKGALLTPVHSRLLLRQLLA